MKINFENLLIVFLIMFIINILGVLMQSSLTPIIAFIFAFFSYKFRLPLIEYKKE